MKKSSKNIYKELNLIRCILCIAVLLYHIGILKGGYLAVCTFFVLSGYLSCTSLLKKDRISLFSYYKNKIKKLYIPLLVTIFISLFAISFIKNINWLNLKPETTSVILGYNNYWQINANQDYFSRHINSPFIHFWYIAILLQFDLIFPFIFLTIKKIGDKLHKSIPCIITSILSILLTIYFYKSSLTQNITFVYYDTFCRAFSLLFGVTIGFIHTYYKPLISSKINYQTKKFNFYFYLLLLITLFFLVDANSKYFAITMIITTLISCRLIDYATSFLHSKENIFDKLINQVSSISYEIYLVQYPVIFIFQSLNINNEFKLPLMIMIILLFSYILNCALNIKGKKLKFIRITLLILTIPVVCQGSYIFYKTKDHTEEMKRLELQLAENQKLFQEKQKEFKNNYKKQEEKLQNALKELENDEKNLQNVITNLPIIGIGDSIMLGALKDLYETFPNGYFDAKISRTAWVVSGVLNDLKSKNIIGNPILLNFGTNGDCPDEVKIKIIESLNDKKIFWVNIVNDNVIGLNEKLNTLASTYTNLHIIDWHSISKDHPEYFIIDGIHLTQTGKKAYTKAIYDAIYQVYLNEYNEKKDTIINQFNEEKQNKITFYGDELLLNTFNYLEQNFTGSTYNIQNQFSFDKLKEKINQDITTDTITNKIILGFNQANLGKNEYLELIKLLENKKVYIITINKNSYNSLIELQNENIILIDFYQEIIKNSNYLMADEIHLTDEGNIALSNILKNIVT